MGTTLLLSFLGGGTRGGRVSRALGEEDARVPLLYRLRNAVLEVFHFQVH